MNYRILTTALLLLHAALLSILPAQTYGALGNPTGRPIGGGEGYGDWILLNTHGTVVATRQQLVTALAGSHSGSIVYVRDDAEIDVSGLYLELHAGVTLASGRGRNGSLGGLLYSNTLDNVDTIAVEGTGVRVTGLRLRGPDTNIDPGDCGGRDTRCIAVYDPFSPLHAWWNVTVDNNEIWGWPGEGVRCVNVDYVWVHHNHVHHNRREVSRSGCHAYGYGYGVCTWSGAMALVEANLFDHNRHDIACDGNAGSRYEARYNLIMPGAFQQSFDVHGGYDRHDGTNLAGSLFSVHHNTFLQDTKPAFLIRGVPSSGAFVWNNEFRHSLLPSAVEQEHASGNLFVHDNHLGVDQLPGWFVSFSGSSFWRFRRFDATAMSQVHLADFDGDGTADAFRVVGNQWQLSRSAREDWQTINVAGTPFSQLRFGDFNGDGKTDVFWTDGHTWWVSWSGTSMWQAINGAATPVEELGFADFDGDGRTDVFWGDGQHWYVSWGGTSAWSYLNTANNHAGGLAFGDFNGDGRDDVFWTDGTTWRVSWGGTSMWQAINGAATPLQQLAFADLNGDGRTDVFWADGATWRVSWSGTSLWNVLQTSSLPTASLRLADVNGDHKADVLSLQNP